MDARFQVILIFKQLMLIQLYRFNKMSQTAITDLGLGPELVGTGACFY